MLHNSLVSVRVSIVQPIGNMNVAERRFTLSVLEEANLSRVLVPRTIIELVYVLGRLKTKG